MYKIAAHDGYLNVCFVLARMSSVGNRSCPIDTPAEPGGTLVLLALKCLAALAAHTLFKNKGVAVNRFCRLIMTSIVTFFQEAASEERMERKPVLAVSLLNQPNVRTLKNIWRKSAHA